MNRRIRFASTVLAMLALVAFAGTAANSVVMMAP